MPFAKKDLDGTLIRRAVTIDCQQAIIDETETILVEQHHKEEVDINEIVKRHAGKAELLAATSHIQGLVFDDNPLNDFQEAMNMLIKGKESFASMPSEVRDRFGHNAAKFMDFVRNPENSEQLIKWGLQNPPEPPPAPMQVEVVNPTTETPPESA